MRKIQWFEASYPPNVPATIRVTDSDMNFDSSVVEIFKVRVWSDSDFNGLDIFVIETGPSTGVFENTVFLSTVEESLDDTLFVSLGDTITAKYVDTTLPDSYLFSNTNDIVSTSLMGTIVPPIGRPLTANLRIVDSFGNSLDNVEFNQQVQLSADLSNGSEMDQPFAFLVQIQDGNGVTVSLSWITGSLPSGQSFSPALSWIPTTSGTYSATAFHWISVDNPTTISPPVSTTIVVRN